MSAFTHHIFVCGNQRDCGHPRGCCDPDGNNALRDALKAALKARGRECDGLVRVNSAGCLDQCELGPALVIYPQGIWYGNVQMSDIPRIVEAVIHGTVVEDLVIAEEMLNTKGKGPQGGASAQSTTTDGPLP